MLPKCGEWPYSFATIVANEKIMLDIAALVLCHRINVPSSGKVKRISSEYKITVRLWCIFDFFPGKNINVLILLCITIVCVGKNSFHSDLNFEFENVFVVLMNAVIA